MPVVEITARKNRTVQDKKVNASLLRSLEAALRGDLLANAFLMIVLRHNYVLALTIPVY